MDSPGQTGKRDLEVVKLAEGSWTGRMYGGEFFDGRKPTDGMAGGVRSQSSLRDLRPLRTHYKNKIVSS